MMEHKFIDSENDDRRHCMYCGFYEDYAELHCPARAEETKLIEAAPDMYAVLKRIMEELPVNRDWFDPDLEKLAKGILIKIEGGRIAWQRRKPQQ